MLRANRSAAEALHFTLLKSLLISVMLGSAGAAECRAFFAAQIAKGLPIHPDAASPETPDFVILAEMRRAVLGAPSLAAWHGDARAYLRYWKQGRDLIRDGDHSWNVWLSRAKA